MGDSKKYVTIGVWFAWRPVHTKNAGWVWWKYVTRTIDERPEVYLGLLPEISYEL
jgi:hypothetical protein